MATADRETTATSARLIVSEPYGELAGAWNEVPESMYGVIQDGDDVMKPFLPLTP